MLQGDREGASCKAVVCEGKAGTRPPMLLDATGEVLPT